MHDVIFSMTNIYINSNLNPLTKFTSSNICKYISTEFKDILSWNISQMITKTVPITTRSHKLCDEIGHPIANLMESQWKLRQQHDHNFQMEGKSLQNKYQRQKKERNPKEQNCENHSLGSQQEVNHLSKILRDSKIITELTRSISSIKIGKAVLMMDVKVSKAKNIS